MIQRIIIRFLVPALLLIWGAFCFMKSYGYCNEYSYKSHEYLFQHYEARNHWNAENIKQNINKRDNDRKSAQEAYDYHHYQAVRCYQDAYERVWWLPDLSWRKLGRDAWVAACASSGGSDPKKALVIAFMTFLSQYGLHCLDEWDYIQDKLAWSKYHFDECANYASRI